MKEHLSPESVAGPDDCLTRLRQSPLFHFSLGSKELFHTNFIAWLCESYPSQAAPLFSGYLRRPPASRGTVTVHREHEHHDLEIRFPDGQVLVVEAKIKSAANPEQLERYGREHLKREQLSYLLLAAYRPSFFDPGTSCYRCTCGATWKFVALDAVARRLATAVGEIEAHNPYHGRLLADYCDFAIALTDLVRAFAIDFNDEDADFLGFLAQLDPVRDLRIHDLVHKYRYSWFAHHLSERLTRDGFVVKQALCDCAVGEVFVEHGFTNGTGLASAKYVLDVPNRDREKPSVAVQLQANDFRLFLCINDNGRADQAAAKLADLGLWFDFGHVPTNLLAPRPTRKRKDWRHFGSHVYRGRVLTRLSPVKLADLFVAYMKMARENKKKLSDVVRNVK